MPEQTEYILKTSEKLIENLFNIYFHRLFQLGEVCFFSPSQPAENRLGFDGSFKLRGVSEILLQYKQPYISGGKFSFKINPDQQEALIKYRDERAHNIIREYNIIKNNKVSQLVSHVELILGAYAYYAVPLFIDLKQVNEAQDTCTHCCDFLNNYILISALKLPIGTSKINYGFKNNKLYVNALPENKQYGQPINFSQVCSTTKNFKKGFIGWKHSTHDYTTLIGPTDIGFINEITDLLTRNETGTSYIVQFENKFDDIS